MGGVLRTTFVVCAFLCASVVIGEPEPSLWSPDHPGRKLFTQYYELASLLQLVEQNDCSISRRGADGSVRETLPLTIGMIEPSGIRFSDRLESSPPSAKEFNEFSLELSVKRNELDRTLTLVSREKSQGVTTTTKSGKFLRPNFPNLAPGPFTLTAGTEQQFTLKCKPSVKEPTKKADLIAKYPIGKTLSDLDAKTRAEFKGTRPEYAYWIINWKVLQLKEEIAQTEALISFVERNRCTLSVGKSSGGMDSIELSPSLIREPGIAYVDKIAANNSPLTQLPSLPGVKDFLVQVHVTRQDGVSYLELDSLDVAGAEMGIANVRSSGWAIHEGHAKPMSVTIGDTARFRLACVPSPQPAVSASARRLLDMKTAQLRQIESTISFLNKNACSIKVKKGQTIRLGSHMLRMPRNSSSPTTVISNKPYGEDAGLYFFPDAQSASGKYDYQFKVDVTPQSDGSHSIVFHSYEFQNGRWAEYEKQTHINPKGVGYLTMGTTGNFELSVEPLPE